MSFIQSVTPVTPITPITPITTNTSFYPPTNSPSSDGSISSCSDNSIFSVNSGYSTASSNGNIGFRNNCNPSRPSPSIKQHLKTTSMTNFPIVDAAAVVAAVAAAAHKKNMKNANNILPTTTERISGLKQLPSPPAASLSPKVSFLGKRRHSADEVMFLSLPPARRGIVNSITSEKPSPPLTALSYGFSDDSFHRYSNGRVRVEVVPTPVPVADDMELYSSENEDKQLKNKEEEGKEEEEEAEEEGINDNDSDIDRYSAAGSPLYELGEPVKPYKEHPSHPLHSLEKSLICKICLGLMLAPHGLSCGHTFCGICLALWIDGAKTTCFECHAKILPTQHPMIPNFKLDGTVELVAQKILDESEMEVRHARKLEWLRYSYSRMPGVRPYSALLREQYAILLRGIQDASVDSKMDCPSTIRSAVAPEQEIRSKPIPIPKGPPRLN